MAGGAWQTTICMDNGDDTWSGDVPTQPLDTVVEWYLTATGADPREVASWAKALGRGPGELPTITSTKSMVGHALGAAGAIEAVAVVLSMLNRLIPPTDGLESFDPELPGIDVVQKEARAWTPGPSLSNSFGFGGHNGTLVIAPAE